MSGTGVESVALMLESSCGFESQPKGEKMRAGLLYLFAREVGPVKTYAASIEEGSWFRIQPEWDFEIPSFKNREKGMFVASAEPILVSPKFELSTKLVNSSKDATFSVACIVTEVTERYMWLFNCQGGPILHFGREGKDLTEEFAPLQPVDVKAKSFIYDRMFGFVALSVSASKIKTYKPKHVKFAKHAKVTVNDGYLVAEVVPTSPKDCPEQIILLNPDRSLMKPHDEIKDGAIVLVAYTRLRTRDQTVLVSLFITTEEYYNDVFDSIQKKRIIDMQYFGDYCKGKSNAISADMQGQKALAAKYINCWQIDSADLSEYDSGNITSSCDASDLDSTYRNESRMSECETESGIGASPYPVEIDGKVVDENEYQTDSSIVNSDTIPYEVTVESEDDIHYETNPRMIEEGYSDVDANGHNMDDSGGNNTVICRSLLNVAEEDEDLSAAGSDSELSFSGADVDFSDYVDIEESGPTEPIRLADAADHAIFVESGLQDQGVVPLAPSGFSAADLEADEIEVTEQSFSIAELHAYEDEVRVDADLFNQQSLDRNHTLDDDEPKVTKNEQTTKSSATSPTSPKSTRPRSVFDFSPDEEDMGSEDNIEENTEGLKGDSSLKTQELSMTVGEEEEYFTYMDRVAASVDTAESRRLRQHLIEISDDDNYRKRIRLAQPQVSRQLERLLLLVEVDLHVSKDVALATRLEEEKTIFEKLCQGPAAELLKK